ncbi:hypothetical protein Tco_0970435 [Tanacetum coccineum]
MSDSEDSTVTYTEVSSLFADFSNIGSPGVVVYGYDGLPIMPEDPYVEASLQAPPPSPDYIPGPEVPQAPLPPEFVPKPEYPEYLVPSNVEVLMEEQPYATDASPTALLPGYIADSNPKEDEDKEDLEKDPADYPADGGDEDDDDESSDDDDDDDDIEVEEEEEEEEPPAPADSTAITSPVDHAPSAEET